jgi:peptidoglycan/xylan/chitin deacetylase (PgdA/CDA1 family)
VNDFRHIGDFFARRSVPRRLPSVAKVEQNPVPMKSFVKGAVYRAAHVSGLSRALGARYRGRGIIFALHSVVADDAVHADRTLRCPVGKLEWILRRLKTVGVDFVTLEEAVRRLNLPPSRPFAAFTFDDGFADNVTNALPIMEKYAAPFTVYVTTGMVTRDIDGWWFGLGALIRSQDKIALPGLGTFTCADPAAKAHAFAAIEAAVHNNFDLLPAVRNAIASAGIDIGALVDREALTEAQLRELAHHPLVTIGAHTMTHVNLARAAAATVRSEMDENRRFLEGIIAEPVDHFAYPFGHPRACGEREAEISRSLGFRTAVTTRPGMVFAEHRDELHALPRVCLEWDENASTLHCKLNGFNRAVHSRLGDPIARM